jgi:hypothetical protein
VRSRRGDGRRPDRIVVKRHARMGRAMGQFFPCKYVDGPKEGVEWVVAFEISRFGTGTGVRGGRWGVQKEHLR